MRNLFYDKHKSEKMDIQKQLQKLSDKLNYQKRVQSFSKAGRSPEQEAQFAISGVQSQITALDSEASTMDPLTQEYRDYVDQRKF